jgi:hypothetical protein
MKLVAALLFVNVLAVPTLEELALRMKQMQASHTALKAEMDAKDVEIKEMKARLQAIQPSGDDGRLVMFADGRTNCPDGLVEVNITAGSLLVGAPGGLNGSSGRQIGRPLAASELGRTGPHNHDIKITDPGHLHSTTVNDPGHQHAVPINWDSSTAQAGSGIRDLIHADGPPAQPTPFSTPSTKTGITVTELKATTDITATATNNDKGEYYPLVYILVCK